jgi:hypothetical protein
MVRRPLDISCVVPLSLNPATVVVFLWHYPSRLAKGASGNMIAACDRATHRGPFRSCQSNWWSSHFKAQHSRSVPPSEYRSLRSGRQLGDFGDLRSHGTDEGRLLGRGFTSITMSPMVARQLYEALERHSMGTPNNSAPYLLNRRKRKIKSRAATMQRLGTLVAVAVSTWWTAAGDFSLIAQEQKTADVSTYPQLNNSVGGSCTGVVIDRHADTDRGTLPLQSPHRSLSPSQRTRSATSVAHVHALVADYSVGVGYDPNSENSTLSVAGGIRATAGWTEPC